jgi:pumilio family protein 6
LLEGKQLANFRFKMAVKESVKRKSFGKDHKSDGRSTKKQRGKNGDGTKTEAAANSSELSSSAQKRQVRKDRQSHRRHADTVAEAKFLWNQLRMKSNTPDDTKERMEKLMTLIRGKVAEIALQHDASRVVQAAIQFGNESQRRELLTEICSSETGCLSELAKIQYAHFCCLKFIKYCARDEASAKMIIKV